MKRENILKNIDKLQWYYEKMEYLNGLFLKVKTVKDENMIFGLIEQLKMRGV